VYGEVSEVPSREIGERVLRVWGSGLWCLLGLYFSVFLGPGVFVLGQVLKCFLKGQDRFRDVIQAEAVGPVPLAGFVLVADFNHDLGQRDRSAVVHHDISEYGGSDSADFERGFGF